MVSSLRRNLAGAFGHGRIVVVDVEVDFGRGTAFLAGVFVVGFFGVGVAEGGRGEERGAEEGVDLFLRGDGERGLGGEVKVDAAGVGGDEFLCEGTFGAGEGPLDVGV